jgi:hypothetical protein
MSGEIENIIESIARYLYGKIHVNISCIAKEQANNQYSMYEVFLVKYADLFIPDNMNHVVEIGEMYHFHLGRDTNGVLTLEGFVSLVSDQYTFYNKVKSMTDDSKFSKFANIMNATILEYVQYIKMKNINSATQEKLKEYLKKLIRKNGSIIQFGPLSTTKGTVPRPLFERLIKIAKKKGVLLYGSS